MSAVLLVGLTRVLFAGLLLLLYVIGTPTERPPVVGNFHPAAVLDVSQVVAR